ncbi:unnamed protein product [Adineta steineri]|uniref:Uncharacterized protein n=1 Tax=Adineta steineri TaxID=433720 RepID=A0A820SLV8_9BILA|nr:unnamed protein product [Adineta steineri]
MANIGSITTTAGGSLPVVTQLWVYKCPTCDKDIVSYTYTLSTRNWIMNTTDNAAVYGNTMIEPPEINCSEHNQRVQLRSLTLHF